MAGLGAVPTPSQISWGSPGGGRAESKSDTKCCLFLLLPQGCGEEGSMSHLSGAVKIPTQGLPRPIRSDFLCYSVLALNSLTLKLRL